MKVIEPIEIIKLFIVYMENNVPITGLTDLNVIGKDKSNNIILNESPMTENIGIPGEYFFNWDVNNSSLLEKFVNIYYMKGSEILDIEEFYFTLLEDMDGHAS